MEGVGGGGAFVPFLAPSPLSGTTDAEMKVTSARSSQSFPVRILV